jgi:hypothetical protein
VKAQKTAIDPRQAGFMAADGSGNLFSESAFRRTPGARRRLAPELAAARVLCNQLRRKRVSAEKKRIVHLICLNLLAVLKRRP